MPGNLATPGTSVVERAVSLLFAFDSGHPRLTVSQLAERTGIPMATAHRLVGQLVAAQMLVKDADGRCAVSRRVWQIGALAPTETRLRDVAVPFLGDLHATTRATVHLAVRDGVRALYIERLYGHSSVPVISTVGSSLPLHSTGVGKALLAYAPPDAAQEALRRLTRHTPYTVISPGRMAQQLEQIRRVGYASTEEEMALGACSVAVPIRAYPDPQAPVVAALGVVVPPLRRDRERLVAALEMAATGISRVLAATPDLTVGEDRSAAG